MIFERSSIIMILTDLYKLLVGLTVTGFAREIKTILQISRDLILQLLSLML